MDDTDGDTCSTRRIGSVNSRYLVDTLQPDTPQVAVGYCIYSSSCVFVMTLGADTHGFTFNRANDKFILTHPDIQIPQLGQISSFNGAKQWEWDQPNEEELHVSIHRINGWRCVPNSHLR